MKTLFVWLLVAVAFFVGMAKFSGHMAAVALAASAPLRAEVMVTAGDVMVARAISVADGYELDGSDACKATHILHLAGVVDGAHRSAIAGCGYELGIGLELLWDAPDISVAMKR